MPGDHDPPSLPGAEFNVARRSSPDTLRSFRTVQIVAMNIELTKLALEKVGNPHILVNLVSRRVRQLNSGAGGSSRPLVNVTAGMGAADIAMLELIEEKIGWEMAPSDTDPEPVVAPKKRARRAAKAA